MDVENKIRYEIFVFEKLFSKINYILSWYKHQKVSIAYSCT